MPKPMVCSPPPLPARARTRSSRPLPCARPAWRSSPMTGRKRPREMYGKQQPAGGKESPPSAEPLQPFRPRFSRALRRTGVLARLGKVQGRRMNPPRIPSPNGRGTRADRIPCSGTCRARRRARRSGSLQTGSPRQEARGKRDVIDTRSEARRRCRAGPEPREIVGGAALRRVRTEDRVAVELARRFFRRDTLEPFIFRGAQAVPAASGVSERPFSARLSKQTETPRCLSFMQMRLLIKQPSIRAQ